MLVFDVQCAAAFATHGADEPGGAAGAFPGPVLLEIVLAGLQVASRDKDYETNESVEDGIDEDTP